MTDYQPTDAQITDLAAGWFAHPWAMGTEVEHKYLRAAMRDLSALPAFRSIIRAAQAEALREARVRIEFGDTVPNDGEYEYTITGDCDGSNVRYLRRKPKYVGDYHPWEPSTEQAWAAAQYPNPADRIEAADV